MAKTASGYLSKTRFEEMIMEDARGDLQRGLRPGYDVYFGQAKPRTQTSGDQVRTAPTGILSSTVFLFSKENLFLLETFFPDCQQICINRLYLILTMIMYIHLLNQSNSCFILGINYIYLLCYVPTVAAVSISLYTGVYFPSHVMVIQRLL